MEIRPVGHSRSRRRDALDLPSVTGEPSLRAPRVSDDQSLKNTTSSHWVGIVQSGAVFARSGVWHGETYLR